MGEVAKRLTPETLITMPDVNWRSVKGLREVIAHDYDDVDVEVLAGVVRDDLPGLRATVSASLASSCPPKWFSGARPLCIGAHGPAV